MNIAVIGSGYVGLVTGACFAHLGNQVICVDKDRAKIAKLKKGIIPIFEPGLKEMIQRNKKEGRLKFTTSIPDAVKKSECIFIAVSTPPKENGEADLTAIENVAIQIARAMRSYRLIVEKSTVPVKTGMWVEHTIRLNHRKNVKFDVASNPEFLREGQALSDFLHPDRIVIGVESKRALKILKGLYRPLHAPILVTDIKSAELIKHACNSFLAAKISFINAISRICELTGADIGKVAEGMGLDKRIGANFLEAGVGYGGFCFPKDLDAFISIATSCGYDFRLLKEVRAINKEQREFFIKKVESALWNIKSKTICILGLSFKPGTDDIRFTPALYIIRKLQAEGAKIKAYDPKAMFKFKKEVKGVSFCRNPYDAASKADCLVIITDWPEFKSLDIKRLKKLMKHPLIIDGRNIFDKGLLERSGFRYIGVGR
ncbi:MAG: UDP-glucose/GDP-mannose dehydrogenase family protein [Candidatus Omnitrophica bacterium]|nr:UDP-glucose/GDP-mannose dehydrogenase family protein [Candidatus Omnitrophota bacterium]